MVVCPPVVKLLCGVYRARLWRQEQLTSVPNDWAQHEQCLMNASFVAAVDPR
jgi:hypothetical protein